MAVNITTDELGTVAAQTDEQKIVHALALLVTSRGPFMDSFGAYLLASQRLETWLNSGAPTDAESAAEIAPAVREALSSLTSLGSAALGVAGVAARAAGVQPNEATN